MTKTSWGWLPILTLIASFGLLIVGFSTLASAHVLTGAMLVFWAGIVVIFLPCITRLWNTEITRKETIAILIMLGLVLYIVSILRAPLFHVDFDELLHWRTSNDILRTQRLFTYNTNLPVSGFFPGIELITTAIVNLTGLTIFQASLLVVAAARLMMIAALFLIFEQLSGSTRTAAFSTIAYMGSSTFVFFDTQFAYESLSIPLAAYIIWLILKRGSQPHNEHFVWSMLAALSVLILVITHHTTSYILSFLLLIWTVVAFVRNRMGKAEFIPFRLTLFLIIWELVWLLTVAQVTVGYLAPHVNDTIKTLLDLMVGTGFNRPVLASGGKSVLQYERIVAIGSVLFLMAGLGLGLWQWLLKERKSALSILFALMAVAYPILPLMRLNSSTWEVSNRMASILFLGIGFIVGLGLTGTSLPPLFLTLRRYLVIPGLAIIFCGGLISGSNPLSRLPGPYLVEADSRSIDGQGLALSTWSRTALGYDNRFASDRVQASLLGSYGGQSLVFRHTDDVNISPIFLSKHFTSYELGIVRKGRIRFIAIDHRITTDLPLYGYYFESWEGMMVPFTPPVSPAVLEKFDTMQDVSRICDTGDIAIYDLGGLLRAP